jgi:hypothetical protein
MENEQCGICWNLEFDKQGDKTHKKLNKYSHNFVPLDYCIKCLRPKYDSYGFQTHLDKIHNFVQNQNISISHKFISGVESKYQEKKRRRKHVFSCIGFMITNVIILANVLNLFF